MSLTLLITGGTGTFGKTFVNFSIEKNLYSKIIIFSRDEYKQHKMINEIRKTHGQAFIDEKIRFFIGDVRDIKRLKTAMRNVDHVIHAAALKHVPFCEYNPDEALKTNVDGTKNVCDAAIETEVKKLVVLSTDKAVEPINFYGSSKMLAEKYAIYSNNYSKNASSTSTKKITKISCVRYGNIVGSRGSIVELFHNMRENEYFSVTDREMTRFWMSIDKAVEMVYWSLNNCLGGEIIIPKIKASSILKIAEMVDAKKPVKIIGVRPGEKIHEQLFHRREYLNAYDVGEYYAILPERNEWDYSVKEHYRNNFKLTKRESYFSNDKALTMSDKELKNLIEFEVNRLHKHE